MTFPKILPYPGCLHLLLTILSMSAGAAQATNQTERLLYDGKPSASWHVTVAGYSEPEKVLAGDTVVITPKPSVPVAPGVVSPETATGPVDPQTLSHMVSARVSDVAGKRDALTLQWKDAWFASLRLDGGAPLDLRSQTKGGTLEFDMNVIDLARGGIYFAMLCGDQCNRKLKYVLPGRALQGRGWRHLSFPMSCFARDDDDFSKVPAPFALEANGSGEVAVTNIKLVAHGQPNESCPDYRTESAIAAPATHAWTLDWWIPRHEKKLDEIRKLKQAGRSPQLVFIGDSITEGWEKNGLPVWQRYYEKYDAVDLGVGGDQTENVLWRVLHGEVDGIAPKVAVLMLGTNNAGHRQDAPKATAAGIKRIIAELRQRLPHTKILLLAIFPRGEQPTDLLRRINGRVNAILPQLADNKNVFFLDINAALLNPDGTLSRDVMPDLLHPNEKGYDIWARTMQPTLQKLLSE